MEIVSQSPRLVIDRSKAPESESSPAHSLTTYAALLRGINVGGKNKVEMAKLKQTFERLGLLRVETVIASGNVVFCTAEVDQTTLVKSIESAFETDFGISARVVLRDLKRMHNLVREVPASWTNDKEMRCDIMFLLPEVDNENVLQQLSFDPTIEDVKYIHGVVLWRIDRNKVAKSRMVKIVGTPLYRQLTIRNANTVRKLYERMVECHSRTESPK